ncbi:MAG: S8 family serine peptidase [Microcoleaceae cyanobacterium]
MLDFSQNSLGFDVGFDAADPVRSTVQGVLEHVDSWFSSSSADIRCNFASLRAGLSANTPSIHVQAEQFGSLGNDILFGTVGEDRIAGLPGDDDLLGDDGNDSLYGGQGLDVLLGGSGNDYLSGDLESDFLSGEGGADIFALSPVDPFSFFLTDFILDFEPMVDFIGLVGELTEADLLIESVELEPGQIDTLIWHSAANTLLGVVSNVSAEQLAGRFIIPESTAATVVSTLSTAVDLGTPSPTLVVNGQVDDTNPEDIYRFTLDNESDLNLSLTGLGADADVVLVQDLNDNGEIEVTDIIDRSEEPASLPESLAVTALPVGTYYVVVYQYDGNTPYTLSLSTVPNLQLSPDLTGEQFDSRFGYGLVDASAAVAQAIGLTPFASVPDLGGNDWGRDTINAPEVWATGTTGVGVTVAVIDSGVDYTHPDLVANIWTNGDEVPNNGLDDDGNGFVDDRRGWDFVDRDSDPMDLNSHGTHVAGIIAAQQDGIGITGVAPNAQIMSIRVLDEEGFGKVSDAIAGIQYAVENGADVINLSLGGDGFTPAEFDAIQWATQQGVVVVMAAGNEAATQPNFPARFASNFGLAVGSSTQGKTLSSFSNQAGTTVLDYVLAPGGDGGFPNAGDIYSTVPPGLAGVPYQFFAGTSMATPHVVGVVALIKQANPNLTAAAIEQIIVETSSLSGLSLG